MNGPDVEQSACDLVGRVLDIRVVKYDDNSHNGMVDGLFADGAGVVGALEVTTVADSAAMAVTGNLRKRGPIVVPGSNWGWHARLPPGTRVKEYEQRVTGAVLACERAGVPSPNEYPLDLPMNEDVAWFTANEVE